MSTQQPDSVGIALAVSSALRSGVTDLYLSPVDYEEFIWQAGDSDILNRINVHEMHEVELDEIPFIQQMKDEGRVPFWMRSRVKIKEIHINADGSRKHSRFRTNNHMRNDIIDDFVINDEGPLVSKKKGHRKVEIDIEFDLSHAAEAVRNFGKALNDLRDSLSPEELLELWDETPDIIDDIEIADDCDL